MQGKPVRWRVKVECLGDEVYTLTRPIWFMIEQYDDGSTAARFQGTQAFAVGPDAASAVAYLNLALLDLYDELHAADPQTLGQWPIQWKKLLNRLIKKGQHPRPSPSDEGQRLEIG